MSQRTLVRGIVKDARRVDGRYSELLEAVVRNASEYPGHRFSGRGIVICGGGLRYLPSVWVNVNMLRTLGCKLPIQLWHLGPDEIDSKFCEALLPLNVEAVDARGLLHEHPMRILGGWELKPYAIAHSPFEEVLLLDADNVPVVDPTFLFDTPEFQRTGAIFWPDFGRLSADRSIWGICGVKYRDEPEFESGQILVNKQKCWSALEITLHLNAHSDFYYRHIHGDKETFHLAWRKLDQEYSMPPFPIHALDSTMCQHDFEGRRIFQHRNFDKWKLDGSNRQIEGFLFEDECRKMLYSLREEINWMPAGISRWRREGKSAAELAAAIELTHTRYDYHRVGSDRRPITFLADGTVAEGAADCECWWDVRIRDGELTLEVSGHRDCTMRLTREKDGAWRGAWVICECMPIELTPLDVFSCALT